MPNSTASPPAAHPWPLVDDDPEYREYLAAHLRGSTSKCRPSPTATNCWRTPRRSRSTSHPRPDAAGVDGVELIRILRRRTQAGLLVVSGARAGRVLPVVDAGADMHLAKPASFDQVVVAIRAVHRRVTSYSGSSGEWLLIARPAG